MARSQDVRSGTFDVGAAARVSEKTYKNRIARAEPRHGDLLYSREGTYFGIAAEVPDGYRVCLGQRMVLIRPNTESLHYRFGRYWLNSPLMGSYIHGFRDGSVAERLNLPTIRNLPVLLPPLPEQKSIARVLGALDDKIELNRKMNRTLEAMARAIFKSWFVDFDPVRAKAEGRRPAGMDDATAALFPDAFEDSELGEIPAGWKVVSLGEVLDLAYGKALKAENRREGSIPVYGSNGRVGWHDEHLATGPGIVVGRKGNPGVVKWVDTDFYPIDTTFYVEPKEKDLSLRFLFHMLGSQNLAGLAADSAVPGLNRNFVYQNVVVIPSGEVLHRFEILASQLGAKVHANDQESRTLAALRDTLLPKLMSGEVRVRDIGS